MACSEWKTDLDRYVDTELSSKEIAAFDAHASVCVSCAADALSRMQLKLAIQTAGRRYSAPPDLRHRIERQLLQRNRRSLRFWSRPAKLITTAALLMVIAVGGNYGVQQLRREQTLRELADIHVATLASSNPLDVVSSDRHTVRPWFQGKVPFMFNLPDLGNSPFTLIGGRVTYLHQVSGAQLVCEVRKHKVSVFIFPDRSDLNVGISGDGSLPKQSPFNGETWSEGGLRYFIISDANKGDIRKLGELLKSAARS